MTTARQRYEAARRSNDPPWEALPDVARRGWRAVAEAVTPMPAAPSTVWTVYASDSRSPDRTCDSLETGQRLRDDLLTELSGEWVLVEEWANLNVPGALPRWVRYVERRGEVMEQCVVASVVDRVGRWYRGAQPPAPHT